MQWYATRDYSIHVSTNDKGITVVYPDNYDVAKRLERCVKNELSAIKLVQSKILAIETPGLSKVHNSLKDKVCNITSTLTDIINTRLRLKRENEQKRELAQEITSNRSKVHNFLAFDIDEQVLEVLKLGPNFIPLNTTKIFDIRQHKRSTLNNILNNAIGRKMHYISKVKPVKECVGKLQNPNLSIETKTLGWEFLFEMENHNIDNTVHLKQFISKSTMSKVKDLARRNDVIVNIADKNLGLTINNTDWYVKEYQRQLQCTETYVFATLYPNDGVIQKGVSDLRDICAKYSGEGTFTKDIAFLQSRKTKDIKLPSLNLLPKVHKLEDRASSVNEGMLKGRPIINGFAYTTAETSRIVAKHLDSFNDSFRLMFEQEKMTFPIIKNSDELVSKLQELHIPFNDINYIWLVTFDFESLYTNIEGRLFTELLDFASEQNWIQDTSYNFLSDLFHFNQNNGYFHVGHKYIYKQTKGLAMGSYDSQSIANYVLLMYELDMLRSSEMKSNLLLYCRYIDDGFAIIQGNSTNAVKICESIARSMPSGIPITFAINKFSVNFLDLWLEVGENTLSNGHLDYRIYQKKFNTYTYPPYVSNHDTHVFSCITKSELNRYKKKSIKNHEFIHMSKLLKTRLRRAGYRTDFNLYTDGSKHNAVQNQIKTRYIIATVDRQFNTHVVAKQICRTIGNDKIKYDVACKNDKKMKQILLTKKTLHNKIGALWHT